MPMPLDTEKAKHMFTDDIKFFQKVIVFHPKVKNEFLAIRRSMHDHHRPGCWDLPGGNVSFGEKHDDSLRREVKEETGLEVSNLIPIQVITDFKNSIYFLVIGYKSDAIHDNIVLSFEHTDYKWVTKNEFMTLKSSPVLQDLVKLIE